MNVSFVEFLSTVWTAMSGGMGGFNFLMLYNSLGLTIWGFLAFKVFATEALNISMGDRTELPKILVKYVVFIGIFFTWPSIANGLFLGCVQLVGLTFPSGGGLLDVAAVSMQRMAAVEEVDRSLWGLISSLNPLNTMEAVSGLLWNGISIIITSFVMFLCYMLIMLCVAGSLAILAMNLTLGPVFIALAFDKDFRPIAMTWFSATLSYFLLIPLYGAAITAAAAIAGAGINPDMVGPASTGQLWAQLIGPFMSLGLVFSVNKLVNSLVGGAMGSGLASSVMGVASIVPGMAVGKAVGAGFSQLIRTATK